MKVKLHLIVDGPDLSLSHGQVAWALSRGEPPSREMRDQLTYLRQVGVPFEAAELGGGRGNRVRYAFDHLVELGVARFCLRRGMTARETAQFLINNRAELRSLYRRAWAEQPPEAVDQPWVKSRGASVELLANEVVLHIHDRHSERPGTFEVVQITDFGMWVRMVALGEKYPGEEMRTVLPLTRLVLELVAWAREAPETRPGPK